MRLKEFYMYYIVLDLEFNQYFPSLQNPDFQRRRSVFEIIQIGAIKLDMDLNIMGTFNQYIKPIIYSEVSPFITELTGITTEQLMDEKEFPKVYEEFIRFIKDKESILCTWGMSDIRELFRNADYHKIDNQFLPRSYINLQPYASKFLGFSTKKLLKLEYVVKILNIDTRYNFHNAMNDAYYTAKIFKKLHNLSMEPKLYDPNYVKPRPIKRKISVDFDGLIQQFEKMYARDLTDEEQKIIKLAYLMGKTSQFIKVKETEGPD